MPKSCIPGYEDALEEERRLREEIFLGVNPRICGIEIQQITPSLLARLFRMGTPFLGGGSITEAEIIRFLWALSPAFSTEFHPKTSWIHKLLGRKRISVRDAFIADATRHLTGRWYEAEDAIDDFIHTTFLDAPNNGGADSVPYVSGVSWTLYTMAKEPFRWTREQTLHTPLREIYQLTRCGKLEKGMILYNEKSDKIRARWLDDVNAQRAGGNN